MCLMSTASGETSCLPGTSMGIEEVRQILGDKGVEQFIDQEENFVSIV